MPDAPGLTEAARVIEALTGVPPAIPAEKLTRKEKQEQASRIRRFRTLSPQLQEGVLRYGEQLQKSYRS